ncbi:MAG: AAA family ATPase [Cuniculiplasma sp.]
MVNEELENRFKDSVKLNGEIMDEVSKYFVGDREIIKKILASIYASGHILLEDNPGIGKTFVAKLFSSVLGISFRRVQFTPDLLPSDISGTKIWKASTGQFELMKGPIFTNLLLADEINRAPPKTQAALLESMEESQATIEGDTMILPQPFIVIATQNPIEFEGTYPLPEAQMDRFMLRVSFGYPEDDLEILKRRTEWKMNDPSGSAKMICDSKSLSSLRELAELVYVDEKVMKYISSFGKIRKDKRVMAGPSPRGIISLMRISKAYAMVNGRDYVLPDDVKAMAASCLEHRIVLNPEDLMDGIKAENVVSSFLQQQEVPK